MSGIDHRNLMPWDLVVDAARKRLRLTLTETEQGGVVSSRTLTFPLLRLAVCAQCGEPVSMWAKGVLPACQNLHPHKGEWRLREVPGAFVLLAKNGHRYISGSHTSTCAHGRTREVLGPKLAISAAHQDDREEG